jgi:hypothetical protein
MTKILTQGDRLLRPQPQSKPNFEAQLGSLPPDVRSVAESLALREPESAQRYVAQYLAGRGRQG